MVTLLLGDLKLSMGESFLPARLPYPIGDLTWSLYDGEKDEKVAVCPITSASGNWENRSLVGGLPGFHWQLQCFPDSDQTVLPL